MKYIIYFFLLSLLFVSCKRDSYKSSTATETEYVYKLIDGIDSTIKPGDNFFNHVNKSWMENAVIADDQVGVGAYRFLNIPQQELLKTILEEVSQEEHPKGSVEQLVGDFYASGMDTININKRGIEPIKPILDRIDAIKDVESLLQFVATQIQYSDLSMIGGYVSPDVKNSDLNILHLVQIGLGLPDRDYYFIEDPSAAQIQEAYKVYLSQIFELIGDSNARSQADIVYAIEKQLAKSHKTRTERRNINENYNKISVLDLDKRHSNINWSELFNTLGIAVDSLNLAQPVYYDALNSMLTSVPLNHWKLYLKANSIGSHGDLLSQPFQDASFQYSKVLSGQTKQQPRSKRMVRRVDGQIGFALGQLYVKRYFNEDAKRRALDLVNNLQSALEKRINNLEWMSDSTKLKAKEKLFAINKKIGYPDVWRTYNVRIDRSNFFENVVALRNDAFHYEINQLNKPPNRDEWSTTPSTVTAYYNQALNEIVFPAGILQSPYFDLQADDALNYGGIGIVIGHEFTHAFDDQGAKYDKNGNLVNWWTTEDYAKFQEKTQKIVEQYEAFTVLDSVHLKGALTVGENTADNGGVAIAYDAFKLTKQGQDTTKIGGYTSDQRFFLSIANMWRVKMRDEYLRNYVATDPHSPPMWRVNGPLMNFTPFYEAFNVKEGENNYRVEDDRIKIW